MLPSDFLLARCTRFSTAVLIAVTLAIPAVAFAQSGPSWFDPTLVDDSPAAPAVRTRHRGTFNDQDLAFDVVTGETVLVGEDGQAATTVFSTAYIRTDVRDATTRPVLFLFNGGPGASSSPLHLGIGPVRRPLSDRDGSLVANEHSVLDATDMVFIDPPGTGYSRLYREGAGEAFWGIEEDADAILFFINDWITRLDRRGSPIFLMGESYGGTRAVTMLARSESVRFSGAMLLSPGLDFTSGTPVVGNNLPYIFRLPSMAATAAYHGVINRGERSFEEVFEQAAKFAQTKYATALYQGNTLGNEELQQIASELAKLIGLSQEYLIAQNLRISTEEFSDALLTNQGFRTGRLDARVTGAIADYEGKRPPRNDPSMGASGRGGRGTGELLDEYFKTRLGTDINRHYRSLNLDLNSKWNYEREDAPRFYLTVVPLLEQAIKEDPDLRIFVGSGVFDLVTPVMAARFVTSQMDITRDRFTYAVYEAGHTVFDHEESRVRLGNDVRAFIAATLNAMPNAQD